MCYNNDRDSIRQSYRKDGEQMCGPVGIDLPEEHLQFGGFVPCNDMYTEDGDRIIAPLLQALHDNNVLVVDHYNGLLVDGKFWLQDEYFLVYPNEEDSPRDYNISLIKSIRLTQTPWGVQTIIELTEDGQPYPYLGTCA